MSGFGGFDTIKKNKDDEDEDETNKYYTGGTDGHGGGSGLQVLAPKNKDGDQDVYNKMIEAAKKDAEEKPLQSDEDVIQITLYRNGFTVGDGPLRERGIALNDQFLDSLANGVCPKELLKDGKPQDVKLNDKSKEDFRGPAYTAFSGAGNAIGASVMQVDPTSVISVDGDAEMMDVNEKEKTIRVQIKYPNGKKQVAKFNVHHTVNDLIKVIRASGRVNVAFVLQDVKKKVLAQAVFSSTIIDAGLANAVVMVITNI